MKEQTKQILNQLLGNLEEKEDFEFVEGQLSLHKTERLREEEGDNFSAEEDRQWLSDLEDRLQREIANNNYKVVQIAFDLAVSERQFRRRVKNLTGLTPSQYFKEMRLQKAKSILEEGRYKTVGKVSEAVGMPDAGSFTRSYTQRFGVNPSEYLRR